MISALDIRGFRCFKHLHVPSLTRVNLVIGLNNSGKTTLLEAAEALAIGTLIGLLRGPQRRGEQLVPSDADEPAPRTGPWPTQIDLSHLFFGHRLAAGVGFTISSDVPNRSIACTVSEATQLTLLEDAPSPLAVEFTSSTADKATKVDLSRAGGLSTQAYRTVALSTENGARVRFLGTESTGPRSLAALFDEVLLTPAYQLVTDALRIIEPRTDGLGFLSALPRSVQIGALVKLRGNESPLPLGSLGDGFRRLLRLSLHLVTASNGLLLVDEIDTGLHHSVITKMWRLVIETAKRLDVQVFATTHSLDCVEALAYVTEQHPELADDVSAHRIDPGAEETVRFGASRLIVAARNHIEVR